MKAAFATTDGSRVDEHFGRATAEVLFAHRLVRARARERSESRAGAHQQSADRNPAKICRQTAGKPRGEEETRRVRFVEGRGGTGGGHPLLRPMGAQRGGEIDWVGHRLHAFKEVV